MSDDLFESNNPIIPDVIEPEVSDNSGFNIFSFALTPLETILAHILLFSLVWTILYSIYFLVLFFYYNVKHHDRESVRLKRGYEDGYLGAVKIWISNIVLLLVAGVYILFRSTQARYFFGFLVVISFIIKIGYYDLVLIPNTRDGIKKIYKNIQTSLKKLTEKPTESK